MSSPRSRQRKRRESFQSIIENENAYTTAISSLGELQDQLSDVYPEETELILSNVCVVC